MQEPFIYEGKFGGIGKRADWATQAWVGAVPVEGKVGIVIAFRGSANLTNWIEDFTFPRVTPDNEIYALCPACKVSKSLHNQLWVTVCIAGA